MWIGFIVKETSSDFGNWKQKVKELNGWNFINLGSKTERVNNPIEGKKRSLSYVKRINDKGILTFEAKEWISIYIWEENRGISQKVSSKRKDYLNQ